MKISLNWLRELIEIPSHLTPEIIGEKITLHTAELEEIIDTKPFCDLVVAGKLTKVDSHPRSDKLSIGFFDCGEKNPRQVLFGQVHVLTLGEVYPIALPGLVMENGKAVTESELGGVLSQGMVIENTELGMKNSGLLTFEPKDIGKKLSEIVDGSADQIFDIDNKSLTHRPDLMGHWGFAREVAAIFDIPFKKSKTELPAGGSEKIKVDIQTPNCRRFTCAKLSNIFVTDSSASNMFRLEHLGTKSISNIVDITNQVMVLHGQPMHAFDAAKVNGTIIIRQAKDGEALVALDGEEYALTTDDMVIADEKKILSIAGIMGGLESGVTSETTEIIFESANFDPTVIRKTSSRLGLRSDSSMRYENSLDPENCLNGLMEAITRTQKYCPNAELTADITDNYPQKPLIKTILLNPNKVRRLSGITFSDDEIKKNLTKLGFGVETVQNQQDEIIFEVTVPSIRATKDVSIPEDLIEEVVRLYGYGNIASTIPSQPIKTPKINHLRKLEWQIRDILASEGLREVMHSSFVSSTDSKWLSLQETQDPDSTNGYVVMTNAPTLETTYLRQSLLSNLVRDLETELRTHKSVGLFEIGKTYHSSKLGDYSEIKKLALLQATFSKKSDQTFFTLKAKLEKLLFHLGEDQLDIAFVSQTETTALFHPHQTAIVKANDIIIGTLGTIHPSKNSIKKSIIVAAELDIEKLLQVLLARSSKVYSAQSTFPAVQRDLSIIVTDRLHIADVQALAKQHADNLTKIELFDEFTDAEKLGVGKKNLAFHLTFQSKEKTLASEEVEAEFKRIVTALQSVFGAMLRVDF
jgi:phenylalanyl-tRNA synthetase beta chain